MEADTAEIQWRGYCLGPWQILFGEPGFDNGVTIRLAANETALARSESPVYQGSWKSMLPPSTAVSALSVYAGGRKVVENPIEPLTLLRVVIGASHADSEEMVMADGLFEER